MGRGSWSLFFPRLHLHALQAPFISSVFSRPGPSFLCPPSPSGPPLLFRGPRVASRGARPAPGAPLPVLVVGCPARRPARGPSSAAGPPGSAGPARPPPCCTSPSSPRLRRLCYDAFTENMAGEAQLLERRRLYHCAAYNCAASLVCRVFSELKFYHGFLFSEKPEKVGPSARWAPPAPQGFRGRPVS